VILNNAELEGLWIAAGGNPFDAELMASIALAESGGNPDALNPTDNNGTQTSWGLWQISDGTHSEPVPNILDPLVNAQQAVAKLGSQGISAWGTYDSGAYRQFFENPAPVPVPWQVTPPIPPPVPSLDEMANDEYIRWAYRFFLIREVDPVGFSSWMEFLSKGGTRGQLVESLQDSPEGVAVIAAQRKALGLK